MADEKRLAEAEAVEILEKIARSGSDTARIQALRTLHVFRAFKTLRDPENDDADNQPTDFEALDELAPRRADRAQAS